MTKMSDLGMLSFIAYPHINKIFLPVGAPCPTVSIEHDGAKANLETAPALVSIIKSRLIYYKRLTPGICSIISLPSPIHWFD